MMDTEYVIWGIAPETEHEQPLHTLSKTMEEARAVCTILEQKHGVRSIRVQILGLTNGSEVAGMFARAVNI